MNIQVVYTEVPAEIRDLRASGFCPVDVSFADGSSIVDELRVNKNGIFKFAGGLASRVYGNLFGERSSDPRFVVNRSADAFICFLIAALAGVLPHPLRAARLPHLRKVFPWRNGGFGDFTALADLIDRAYIHARLPRLERELYGAPLIMWHEMAAIRLDLLSWYLNHWASTEPLAYCSGVDRWRILTEDEPLRVRLEMAGPLPAYCATRWGSAIKLSKDIAFIQPHTFTGAAWWENACRVAVVYWRDTQELRIRCASTFDAELVFGEGGLHKVYPELGSGWDGSASHGGPKHGTVLDRDAAEAVANKLVRLAGR